MLHSNPRELDFTASGVLDGKDLRRLDDIAASCIVEFNQMMARLADGRERDIDWWVSRPAGRNTHTSRLFAHCSQLALVRHDLDQGVVPRVRTDSAAMASILRQALGGHNVVLVRKPDCLRRNAHDVVSSLYHAMMAKMAAWTTRKLARKLPDFPLYLVETYVLRDSFTGGHFHDRYYPGLYECLDAAQRASFHYLPTFNRLRDYYGTFRAMRQSQRNFLLREDYLRLGDYLFALGHWWRSRRLAGRPARFAGFDVGPLVDADIALGRFANSAFQALLAYRFWRKAPRCGVRVARFLDWYEGHDLDHAMAAALRWHDSTVGHIAYRPISSPAYLSLKPTSSEAASGVIPKRWAVVGSLACDEIRHACPDIVVEPAPGLRWIRGALRRAGTPISPSVLVLLSIETEQVLSLRRILERAMAAAQTQRFRWLLKRHPAMPRQEVEAIFAQQMDSITLVDGAFGDALSQADAVVGLGTNTLIEAAAAGVPVICVSCGNVPTEIPLPPSVQTGWWRMAYDPVEFSALLQEALAVPRTSLSEPHGILELLGPSDPAILRAMVFE